MKTLLLFGKASHNITDEEDHPGNDLADVSYKGLNEIYTIAVNVCNF